MEGSGLVHTALVTGTLTAMTPEVRATLIAWAGALEVYEDASERVKSVLEAYPTIADFDANKELIQETIAKAMIITDQKVLRDFNRYKKKQLQSFALEEQAEVTRVRHLAVSVKGKLEHAYRTLGGLLYPTYRSVCSSLPFATFIHPLC
jgi:ABC-type transporter Mla subunit MlaD